MQKFINWLKNKWDLKSGWELFIILLVFALTGTSVLLIKRPILDYFSQDEETLKWFKVIYWILIFPVYYMILLFYGTLFGKFDFFWAFAKRTFGRITGRKKK